MALGVTDLKKGVLIELDGQPWRVTDYNQKSMGRGGSIVNVRVKNLVDGRVALKTFKGADKIEEAHVENQKAQFLYSDGNNFHFMNPETYEQFQLPADVVAETEGFLKEGEEVDLQFFNENVINVALPTHIYLKVDYTEDVVKGDSQGSVQKDARLETGKNIRVPAFIKIGDEVKVDTRTGEYLERKK
jgi:elongation factor P